MDLVLDLREEFAGERDVWQRYTRKTTETALSLGQQCEQLRLQNEALNEQF